MKKELMNNNFCLKNPIFSHIFDLKTLVGEIFKYQSP